MYGYNLSLEPFTLTVNLLSLSISNNQIIKAWLNGLNVTLGISLKVLGQNFPEKNRTNKK
jgi:hypothetical protein